MSTASELKIDLNERFLHLPHAPIVEAVVEIRARAEEPWEESAVRSHVEVKLGDYAYLDSARVYQYEMRLDAGKSSEQVLRDLGTKGVRFKSGDGKHIAQFNRDGFVFSRLRPYESWEQLHGEAMRLWQIYLGLARPAQVQRLGLRFVNRIELLPNELRYEDYIQPAPAPPKHLDLPYHSFLHHDTLAVPGYPYAVSVVRTIQTAPDQHVAVILDIDVFTPEAFDLQPEVLARRLLEMRWLKNKVFFGSITTKALKIFKQ